jgi:hypothetical protein
MAASVTLPEAHPGSSGPTADPAMTQLRQDHFAVDCRTAALDPLLRGGSGLPGPTPSRAERQEHT